MAFVMNASSQEQQVRVHGAWFTFKPEQIKEMHEDKVFFLVSKCAEQGFVSLPDAFSDPDYKKSKEGQAILLAAKEQGVANRVRHLEWLRHNETVSLQRDIDKQNLKYDARLEMAPEMLTQMEELQGYKIKKQDEAQKRLDRFKEIEKSLEE